MLAKIGFGLCLMLLLVESSLANWSVDRFRAMTFLEQGEYENAYFVAATNTMRSMSVRFDRNFVAGWIALRNISRPGLAVAHFQEMEQISQKLRGSLETRSSAMAKSNFWLAKALESAGRKSASGVAFRKSALYPHTFYGQMALAELAANRQNRGEQPYKANYRDYWNPWRDRRIRAEVVLAVIREESGFDSDAISKVGAFGLMQLMPQTAYHVGETDDIDFNFGKIGTRPDFNVALGSKYLARLVERYQGNVMLAVAAYNAGPANVDKWLTKIGNPNEDAIDPVEWVESIPFHETRKYVKRVIASYVNYRSLYGTDNDSVWVD